MQRIRFQDRQLEGHGIAGMARLELQIRTGENCLKKYAGDVLFICGLANWFPKQVLSTKNMIVDLEVNDCKTRDNTDNKCSCDAITKLSYSKILYMLLSGGCGGGCGGGGGGGGDGDGDSGSCGGVCVVGGGGGGGGATHNGHLFMPIYARVHATVLLFTMANGI